MSIGDDASPYLDPYRDAVRESGAGFESQLWLSKPKQQTRFRVITALAQPRGRVVADIGAGIAEYLPYLHEHDALPKHYIGVEGVPEMTEEGRRRAEALGITSAVFETHDFVADETLARTLVEGVRQADQQFLSADNPMGYVLRLGGEWGLTMGQVLSLPMAAAGLLILLVARRPKRGS